MILRTSSSYRTPTTARASASDQSAGMVKKVRICAIRSAGGMMEESSASVTLSFCTLVDKAFRLV